MNYFAKFEKFVPHSIIIPSFMTIGSQMPELDRGAFLPPPPPYKIGSQNTPYKLGLITQFLSCYITFITAPKHAMCLIIDDDVTFLSLIPFSDVQ